MLVGGGDDGLAVGFDVGAGLPVDISDVTGLVGAVDSGAPDVAAGSASGAAGPTRSPASHSGQGPWKARTGATGSVAESRWDRAFRPWCSAGSTRSAGSAVGCRH
ncbi:hypothetical protein I545_6958 [Mycobacterium kansasii 662]|uniref:Uncharacterized protein n=1 Tax=Mycobacterium kansasii 662 TaxID=1299326 RepID=X7XPL9_MYCKA|nr:hypothetical protein I545_6958 [Mycobacterium kansasii 662]